MKKIIISIFLVFVLSSCFSWDETDENTWLILKDLGEFSLLVPNSWEEVNANKLPVPKKWELVYSIVSKQEKQGYKNNIIILKAENKLDESSQELMKNNINFLKTTLQSFTLKQEENILFQDQEKGTLITFSWQYSKQTPEVVYLQTARACGEMSYFLTLSLAEKLDDYSRYAHLLKSFSCTK